MSIESRKQTDRVIVEPFKLIGAAFLVVVIGILVGQPAPASAQKFDLASVPLPDALPPGFINMTDKTWHPTLMGAKVGDKVREDFTAVDLMLCANEKGYAAKKAAFAIKDVEAHQKKLDTLIDEDLCSEIKWGELMVVTAVTPETVTLVDAAKDGTPNGDDRLHIFHKKSEPIDITPDPQITSANSDREHLEANQSSNNDNNAPVFGEPGHIRPGGTMACVLRQALIQVVAIANEIGKHAERHATDAALDVAEKIGCRAVVEGTAIEVVDRVGPYVQYHELGRAELLWTVSNFVGP